MLNRFMSCCISTVAVAILPACGGGGDSSPAAPVNSAPLANAGINQTATVGQIVTLNGTGSSDANGDPLTYKWTMTTVPPTNAPFFTELTLSKPTLTRANPGNYVFKLVVNDGKLDSAPTTVAVTVTAAVGPVAARAPAPPEVQDLIDTAVANSLHWMRSPSTFKVVGTPSWSYYDTIGEPEKGAVSFAYDSQNGFGATVRGQALCPANWDTRGYWRNTMQSSLALCIYM